MREMACAALFLLLFLSGCAGPGATENPPHEECTCDEGECAQFIEECPLCEEPVYNETTCSDFIRECPECDKAACAPFIEECPECDNTLSDAYYLPFETFELMEEGSCDWDYKNATVRGGHGNFVIEGQWSVAYAALLAFYKDENSTLNVYLYEVPYGNVGTCPAPFHFSTRVGPVVGNFRESVPLTHFVIYDQNHDIVNEGEILSVD